MSDCVLDSFVFYRSFRDAIREMDEQEQLETLLAICDYALYGVEPNLSGALPRAVFTVARPSIDANKAKRENGLKGGRPPQKAKQETCGFEAKNHRFENIKNTETETGTETGTVDVSGKTPRPRFIPPTVDEIKAYCTERKNAVDAERFIDFYSANGWKQGKGKPIVDWKAAVRTWERQSNAGQDESSPRQYDAATDTWR